MIVDGGLGVELAARGFTYTTGLWSGEAILTRPDLLVTIHRAYLAAGAEMLATATYQVSHAALRDLGYDDAAIDAVFGRAVQLARDAILAHRSATGSPSKYLVAASLGPFGATVGDGSEYSGVQHLERDALYAFHAERVRSVVRAQPDVVLFETIPSRAEAIVVAEVARDLGVDDVWISLARPDGEHTFGGDRVSEIAATLDGFACVGVMGVNCTAPSAVATLVRTLRSVTAKPISICPNVGQRWDTGTRELVGGSSEAAFLSYVPEWLALGVAHIGGCCGVGPAIIRALTELVDAAHAAQRRN